MLRHTLQSASGTTPKHWCWLLHGILGSSQNLRLVARRLVADLPDWGFVLPDLRNHGDSHEQPSPHTVTGCVADLDELEVQLDFSVHSAIGHSFGGKVALAWGASREAASPAQHLWALDVPPGRPDLGLALQSDVVRVVAALRRIPMPLPRRDSIVSLLGDLGFSPMMGQWMTTNLRPGDGGFIWRFDLDGIEAMLGDYAEVDLWPWLEDPRRRTRVDVVRAGRSPRWEPGELARFGLPLLHLHLLPDAGHWVHVDDPDGLHRLLVAGLAPVSPSAP
ncbi:MAG: alpha/beta hydrolase [Myxococcales bacterium]|nr:alpha/beta hydrolase [Myxococcales bacterium]